MAAGNKAVLEAKGERHGQMPPTGYHLSKCAIQLSAVDLERSASALPMFHCWDSRSQAASMVSSRSASMLSRTAKSSTIA